VEHPYRAIANLHVASDTSHPDGPFEQSREALHLPDVLTCPRLMPLAEPRLDISIFLRGVDERHCLVG
jgi:hypothetical protein